MGDLGPEVTVERAVPADAEGIVGVLAAVGAEGRYIANEGPIWSAEQQRQVILQADPHLQLILVVRAGSQVVGTLEMIRGAWHKNRHTATFGMALLPAWRGRRLGERLVREAEAWASAEGIAKISLAVFASNQPALRLYHRLGYQEEGRRYRQYRIDDQWVDEIWMAKWAPFRSPESSSP
ncbi:MAG: GNAT family N-acetyltransferase [Firmicutes bacterium]|nr:GNAT family N-acetyltransferase [Bacillota bacterium]